jgi:hypothetical protein
MGNMDEGMDDPSEEAAVEVEATAEGDGSSGRDKGRWVAAGSPKDALVGLAEDVAILQGRRRETHPGESRGKSFVLETEMRNGW